MIDLASRPVGTFTELPQTRIDAVLPVPLPPVGSGSADSIVTAWGGGAWDAARQRLYLMGGGHDDYAGNEVYALDVPTQRMLRLTDPSPNSALYWPPGDPVPPYKDVLKDGRPASVHVYGAWQHLPSRDALWLCSGSRWRDGDPSAKAWLLDLKTLGWTALGWTAPRKLGISSAVDPATGRVWLRGDQAYGAWDPATPNTGIAWSPLDSVGTYDGHVTACGAGYLLTIGVIQGAGTRCCIRRNLATGRVDNLLPSMTGATEILGTYAPGLDWDGTKFIAYAGGTAIYELSPTTPLITKRTAAAPAPPSQFANGTFGRWRFDAALGGFLYYGGIHQNAWFYKSAASSVRRPVIASVVRV